MEKTLPLNKYGHQLWAREMAHRYRIDLERILDQLSEGDAVVIDASGVEVFDYSFANELFGRSLKVVPQLYPDRFLVVTNLTPYTHENLDKALIVLDLAMIEKTPDSCRLIGKFHPADAETFAAIAASSHPITANELRQPLGLSLNAVNERLSKLRNMGLVYRSRGVSDAGREQFSYSIPK